MFGIFRHHGSIEASWETLLAVTGDEQKARDAVAQADLELEEFLRLEKVAPKRDSFTSRKLGGKVDDDAYFRARKEHEARCAAVLTFDPPASRCEDVGYSYQVLKVL